MRTVALALLLAAACGKAREEAREEPLDRAAVWRDDLRVLADELPKRHKNAFFHTAEATWRKQVADVDGKLASLDDAHVVVEINRLVAAIGDAHTMVTTTGKHGRYRLALIWFEDGIFVGGADDAWAIGRKVVAIDHHPIADAIAAMTPLVPHENAPWLHARLPLFLVDAELLAGLGLARADHATFGLADDAGQVRELELAPAPGNVAVAPPHELPLHLQGPKTVYWNKYVPEQRLLYLQYNACADDPKVGPFEEFADKTLAFADGNPVDRFVIDLRSNTGGNSRVLEPLVDGLAKRPRLAGKVFAIIGMHTFSSAMLNAIELKSQLHATLVGGPTGGTPTSYGEVRTFELPHSKLGIQYSTNYFENSEFHGDSVEPDVLVHVKSTDWFSGRDPAIDAILGYARPTP
jgi:hypothetical protein